MQPGDETLAREARRGDTEIGDPRAVGMDPPLTDGQVFGDFRIIKLLGRGSSGFVYAAKDLVANRRIALKVLCRVATQELCRNKLGFRRMSQVRHPCLLWAQGIDFIEDWNVLLMEEIEGETLYNAVQRMKKLPESEAFERLLVLLHDYATGLAVMHLSELVHRDLKPTNLMVRKDGRGVIVDYGLVARCDAERDPRGIRSYIAGTPKYFSPEALWEQSYTPAGDVYSLGLVMLDCLNEIVGGNKWLRDGKFKDWVREEDEQTIATVFSEINEKIPPRLRMMIAGMLAKERTERPSSLEVASMTSSDDQPIRLTTAHHLVGRESERAACDEWIDSIYRETAGRLHLYGDSGAGKTRLLDEVERELRLKGWGHVFRVDCRSREKGRLQVMDQIADQVAQCYMRHGLRALHLHPVSASILLQAFPQLADAIAEPQTFEDEEVSLPAYCPPPERQDVHAAWVSLTIALRSEGPLFILIDNAQWADPESETLLAELQQDVRGLLGIVTCSRQALAEPIDGDVRQLEIGPLSPVESLSFLHETAKRWGANLNVAGLGDLVRLSRGNPFRLTEFAEEFRPEGILHRVDATDNSSVSNVGDIGRLLRARFDRLSEEAKMILAFIVAANAPTSIADLTALSKLGVRTDGAVFELSCQRLVLDDATGGDCIKVVADEVTGGLIANLPHQALVDCHLAWGNLLAEDPRAASMASRIAGHFYAAGAQGAALPHAILAAERADRTLAKREAGEWHERVLELVTGDAREKHLRDAARCFYEADLPEQASRHFVMLADQAKSDAEREHFQAISAALLIRCGKVLQARPYLVELAGAYGFLPQREAGSKSLFPQLREVSVELLERAETDPLPLKRAGSQSDLRYCAQVSSLLGCFDLEYSLQLVVHGSERALDVGCSIEAIHFAAVSNLWDVMLNTHRGRKITSTREKLQLLRERLRHSDGHPATSEFSRVLAFLNFFAMQWRETPAEVQACSDELGLSNLANGTPSQIEPGHVRWVQLWADWQLGNWAEMKFAAYELVDDAKRRSDRYQQLVMTSGLAGNAFLIGGDLDRLKSLNEENESRFPATAGLEPAEFMCWVQRVQQAIYQSDYSTATTLIREMRSRVRSSLIGRVALTRVVVDQLTALVGLHVNEADEGVASSFEHSMVTKAIRRLERNPSVFARMLGALLRGIEQRQRGNKVLARSAFARAAELAERTSLRPYQLAAEDGIRGLESSCANSSLRNAMKAQAVSDPKSLERLYTVPTS
ncbi:MAG: serine/threonine-protein kinase [Planctomycetota bacterium]